MGRAPGSVQIPRQDSPASRGGTSSPQVGHRTVSRARRFPLDDRSCGDLAEFASRGPVGGVVRPSGPVGDSGPVVRMRITGMRDGGKRFR